MQGQKTIEEVFSRDKFSIPKYQRDYAWKEKNFQDLWEDLQEAVEDPSCQGHFLGTIVVTPNQEDKTKFDIIDGQQRTTTIFMLLYVLICRSEYKETLRIKYLLDKRNEIKLEVISQNQEFLKKLLDGGEKQSLSASLEKEADTQGKKNLYEVFRAILDRVSTLKIEEIDIYREKLLSMILMWLEESNSGRAIRTFQSVNDRGVPLKLLDKLKSLLIYYSNSYCNGEENGLDEKINNDFGEIFKTFIEIVEHRHISSIGNQQFDEGDIFRYHSGSIQFDNVKFLGSHRRGINETYEFLKDEIKTLASKKSFTQLKNFIEHYTEDLKIFYGTFLKLLDCIDTNPLAFKTFLLEKINPNFYNSLVRLKINNELDDQMLELFAKADIFFFKSGSSYDGTAHSLIFQYLQDGKSSLKNGLITGCKKHDIKRIAYNLTNDAYNMQSFHYIFFDKNCDSMDIDTLKILIKQKKITQEKEHIVPQSLWETGNEYELRNLGFDGLDDFEKLKNTWGNLLSLEKSLNGEAQDKDLLSKTEVYKKSKIPFNRQFDTKNFNKQKLEERNKEFARWLEQEFFKEFL